MSDEEYTPTMEEVRDAFLRGASMVLDEDLWIKALTPWDETADSDGQVDSLLGAAFDRWLELVRRDEREKCATRPYLPPDLYNDLQEHLLSAAEVSREALLLAGRLTKACGASEMRRRAQSEEANR